MIEKLLFLAFIFVGYIAIVHLRKYWSYLRSQKYGQHIIVEKNLDNRGYNKKQFVCFLVLSVAFGFLLATINEFYHVINIIEFFQGLIVSLYIYLISTYLAGIILFLYAINHADEMSGKIHFKGKFVHILEIVALLPITIVFLTFTLFVQEPYMFGSASVFICSCLYSFIKLM